MLQWVQHSIPERTKQVPKSYSVTEARWPASQQFGDPSLLHHGARGEIKSLERRSSEPHADTADARSLGSEASTPPVRAASTPPTAAATEYQGISQASKLSSSGLAGNHQRPTEDSDSQGADVKKSTAPNSQDDGLHLISSPGKGKDVASEKPRTQTTLPHNHVNLSQPAPITSNSSPEGLAEAAQDSGDQSLDREGIRQALLAKIGVKPGDTIEYTVHHRDAIVHEQVFPQTHTIYQPTRTYDVHIHEHRKLYQPLLDTEGGQEQDDYYVHSEH
jgi:hypothetical protein